MVSYRVPVPPVGDVGSGHESLVGHGLKAALLLLGDATIAPIAIKVSPRMVSVILDCMRNIELAPEGL